MQSSWIKLKHADRIIVLEPLYFYLKKYERVKWKRVYEYIQYTTVENKWKITFYNMFILKCC